MYCAGVSVIREVCTVQVWVIKEVCTAGVGCMHCADVGVIWEVWLISCVHKCKYSGAGFL